MRENERRLGGIQWGMLQVFEPAEPRPNRTIDQSVVAWRLASKKNGSAAFENPRSSVQRTVNMITGGSNRQNLEPQFCLSPHMFSVSDTPDRMIPIIYRRARFTPDVSATRPYDPEQLRRETATQVNEREMNRRSGFRYPTPAEVEEIQRRFRNPELEHAMEVARQEIMRRYWPRNVLIDPEPREYLAHMTRLISEPAPPGFREAMRAAAGDITEEENLR